MKIGTVCLIVFAPAMRWLEGRVCTVTGHTTRDEFGQNLLVSVAALNDVRAASKCLIPLNGDEGKDFSVQLQRKLGGTSPVVTLKAL